jgi:hypothetical protein
MGNRATENRDVQLRLQQGDGHIVTWADGFGVWHAKVDKTYSHPLGVARAILRVELQDRAPRDTFVDAPRVERTPEDDTDTQYAYKEAPSE